MLIGNYQGHTNYHHVYLIEVDQEPKLDPKRWVEYTWWDGSKDVAIQPHVKGIVDLYFKAREELAG